MSPTCHLCKTREADLEMILRLGPDPERISAGGRPVFPVHRFPCCVDCRQALPEGADEQREHLSRTLGVPIVRDE